MVRDFIDDELHGFTVKKILPMDYRDVFGLQQTNPYYFSCQQDHPVAFDEMIGMIESLPREIIEEQRFYQGLYEHGGLVAIIDYMEDYPVRNCLWINLLMVSGNRKMQGMGKRILRGFERAAMQSNFERIRLECIPDNTECYPFWRSVGYQEVKTGPLADNGDRSRIVLERVLG